MAVLAASVAFATHIFNIWAISGPMLGTMGAPFARNLEHGGEKQEWQQVRMKSVLNGGVNSMLFSIMG